MPLSMLVHAPLHSRMPELMNVGSSLPTFVFSVIYLRCIIHTCASASVRVSLKFNGVVSPTESTPPAVGGLPHVCPILADVHPDSATSVWKRHCEPLELD